MEINIFERFRRKAHYWWVGLLIGLLMLGVGIWSLTVPAATLVTLNIVFIVSFIVGGIGDIFYAFYTRKDRHDWGWILVQGIVSLALGIVLAANPLESVYVLLFYVGFWMMFQSVMMVSSSFSMKRVNWSGWGWMLVLGIIGFIFSFILISNPAVATVFVVTLFSYALILYGCARVFFAFKLRTLHKEFLQEE